MFSIKDGAVVSVKQPLRQEDVDILHAFVGLAKKQAIYIPFDPNTFRVPADPTKYIQKKVGDVWLIFSPNVYQLFMNEYVKTDEQGRKYYMSFPALFVDYMTPLEMEYYGASQPPARPLEQQINDWKNGYQLSRMRLPNEVEKDLKVTIYVGNLGLPRVLRYNAGWYWVKHQARLLSVPAAVLSAERDVFKFYYKKPSGVVYRIPGFSSIADYIIKKKLSGEGVQNIRNMLKVFGYDIDYSTTYRTDSGNVARGPAVEESKDSYVVYIPVVRVGSLAPTPEKIGLLVVLVVIAIGFAVGVYYVYKWESEKNKGLSIYLDALNKAQEQHTSCVEACSKYPTEEERQRCLAQCGEAYAQAINEASKAWDKHKSQSPFKDVTELIKWAVVGIVVINVLPAVAESVRRRE